MCFPLLGQKQSEIFKFERFDKDKLSGNFLPKYKDVVINILAFTTVLITLVPCFNYYDRRSASQSFSSKT